MTAELRVDLDRFRRNVRVVRARMAPAEVLVVVKDDAYALGVDAIVTAALEAGATWFGALDPASALRAKQIAGERARVFVWLTLGADETEEALRAGLELGIGDATYLERVSTASSVIGLPATVHLKVDTGLHRNGVRPEDWPEVVARAVELQRAGRIRVAGIWSHIAEASDAEDDTSRAVFDAAVDRARAAGLDPDVRHLAASAAAWHRPEFRYDLVRVGAFCYGVRSAEGPELAGIEPIATLAARVVGVSPGRATIDVGAADGVLSTLAGRVQVATPAGPRLLLRVGPFDADVEAWDGAHVGDDVMIFGAPGEGVPSTTDLGEAAGTVGEEPLLRVSPLIPRVYSG
ncbi:alanine racemase [Microbacterium cremeum]|uniref:alanine racemase n=1 Tax=Microbacterium cremeum TaxID=2782169 RepID=UPI001886F5BA|nr:alanine racemase [Microbacterium cremeum]